MKKSTSENSNPTAAQRKESHNSRRFHSDKKKAASEHFSKKRTETHRFISSQSRKENTTAWTDSGCVPSEQNLSYKEFLKRVNCPFCLKVQEDKFSLVKHLNEKCRLNSKKRMPFTEFQILPTNAIKCNLCLDVVLNSIENYFFHASEYHGKHPDGSEFLFCSCCKILVPNNGTQLECHLKHSIHNARGKSAINSDYFIRDEIHCIYCFYNGNKKFKCLSCPSPDFLFTSPFEMINHFKASKHLKYIKKNYLMNTVYCCFCDKHLNESEVPHHFISEVHLKREKNITGKGQYELCIYCEWVSSSLKHLSAHMRSNCEVIKKIRKEMGWEMGQVETKTERTQNISKHKIKKDKCILVQDDMDVTELVKTFKNFGKIKHIGPYGDHKLVIEFKNEAAVEFILLVSSFIKINGEKVHIEYMTGAE